MVFGLCQPLLSRVISTLASLPTSTGSGTWLPSTPSFRTTFASKSTAPLVVVPSGFSVLTFGLKYTATEFSLNPYGFVPSARYVPLPLASTDSCNPAIAGGIFSGAAVISGVAVGASVGEGDGGVGLSVGSAEGAGLGVTVGVAHPEKSAATRPTVASRRAGDLVNARIMQRPPGLWRSRRLRTGAALQG